MRFFENFPNPDAFYEPNSFGGPTENREFIEPPLKISGDATMIRSAMISKKVILPLDEVTWRFLRKVPLSGHNGCFGFQPAAGGPGFGQHV